MSTVFPPSTPRTASGPTLRSQTQTATPSSTANPAAAPSSLTAGLTAVPTTPSRPFTRSQTHHSSSSSTTTTTPHPAPAPLRPSIYNVVSTTNLHTRLDLSLIAQHARNAEYNPRRFAAAIMRLRTPRATALLFASGKVVVTGAKSEAEARVAARRVGRVVRKVGFRVGSGGKRGKGGRVRREEEEEKVGGRGWQEEEDLKVQNIVGSVTCGFPVRLEGLATRWWRKTIALPDGSTRVVDVPNPHWNFVRWEPEIFPGLVYRMLEPKVVLLVFMSGKIVLTGAKKVEEIYRAWDLFWPVVLDPNIRR